MSDMSDQSAGGYRAAGWYHAQGDPPGTQRYWDGTAWQGEPQQVHRSTEYPAPETSSDSGSTEYAYEPTSVQAPDPSAAYAGTAEDYAAAPVATGSSDSADVGGFLSTLFDLKFTSFITGRAISVVYILVLIAVTLATLAFVLGGLAGGGASALVALILGPLIGLFYLVMIRMTLEFFVNQFRQTELLEAIADKLGESTD